MTRLLAAVALVSLIVAAPVSPAGHERDRPPASPTHEGTWWIEGAPAEHAYAGFHGDLDDDFFWYTVYLDDGRRYQCNGGRGLDPIGLLEADCDAYESGGGISAEFHPVWLTQPNTGALRYAGRFGPLGPEHRAPTHVGAFGPAGVPSAPTAALWWDGPSHFVVHSRDGPWECRDGIADANDAFGSGICGAHEDDAGVHAWLEPGVRHDLVGDVTAGLTFAGTFVAYADLGAPDG